MNKSKDKREKKQSLMKRKISRILGIICYAAGILGALYVGGWLMLVKPIFICFGAIVSHSITAALVIRTVVKVVLAGTMAGLVWCIGYMGYNHFRGKDEPDWESINARKPKEKSSKQTKPEENE